MEDDDGGLGIWGRLGNEGGQGTGECTGFENGDFRLDLALT
jgi:hypothetical protein